MDDVAQASLEVAKLVADDDIEIQYATKLNEVDTKEYEKSLAANLQHYNTVPQLDILRAKLNMEKSQLQINKATHEIKVNLLKAKQAEAELKTYRIRAPFDGVVTSILKHRGEAVHQGDTILEVVNTAVVRVEGKVNERDIWNVKVGSPVIVHLSIPDIKLDVEKQAFRGKIGFVDVVANSVSFETRVWAEIANPNNVLRPGLQATMTILPAASEGADLKTSTQSGRRRWSPRPVAAMSLVASSPLVSSTRRPIPMRRRPDLVARRIEYQGIGSWVIKDPVGLKYHRLHAEQYSRPGLIGRHAEPRADSRGIAADPSDASRHALRRAAALDRSASKRACCRLCASGRGRPCSNTIAKSGGSESGTPSAISCTCACPVGIPSGP